MQIDAKLIDILPLQTGEGKNRPWKKQDIIVQTIGQYPKMICIGLWNDKIDYTTLEVGNELQIDFDIESRPYNGKWYTEAKAWKIALHLRNIGSQGIELELENGDNDVLPF